MLHSELMSIVKEILEEILTSIKEALEKRDLLYIFILLLMIFSFTAGMIFALGMLTFIAYVFATLLKNALGMFAISMVKLANGKNGKNKKEVQNENKDMEKR
jgi:fatty acid desaturase